MLSRVKQWMQRTAGAGEDRSDGAQTRVLMVCMGNICRSPIAEGVLRAKLQRAGLQGLVSVDSAGTFGLHAGEAPDPRAVRVAAAHGYDIAGLRARQVTPDDFARFDWVLAMDDDNLAWLRKRAAGAAPVRMELLLSHASRPPPGWAVPDPYYGPLAGFEHVLSLVEDACDGLVAQLHAQLSAGGAAKLD
jgi:protein-tyrosine phosphatase